MLKTMIVAARAQWMGALSLFLVIAGGTAYAANTVRSTDIVDDEVYSADVRNDGLSGGGLAASDLRSDSVGSSEVLNNSLSGDDINEQSLTGNARKLNWNPAVSAPPGPIANIVTVGPYTIKGRCERRMITNDIGFALFVYGPAGTAESFWAETRNDDEDWGHHSSGLAIPANTNTAILSEAAFHEYFRLAGTTVLKTGSTLVQVEFHAVVDGREGSEACRVYGTVTKAT